VGARNGATKRATTRVAPTDYRPPNPRIRRRLAQSARRLTTLPLQGGSDHGSIRNAGEPVNITVSRYSHQLATRSNRPCPVVSRFSIVTAVAAPAAPTWNVTALGPKAFSPTGW
jgi:hypothetical protein